MWTPRRGRQQLDLLCHDKRPELRGKTFHEVLVGEDRCPVLPPVGVVIKLPEMDKLVDRAGVGLEVAQSSCHGRPSRAPGSRAPGRASSLPPSCRRRGCTFAIRKAPSGILLHRSLMIQIKVHLLSSRLIFSKGRRQPSSMCPSAPYDNISDWRGSS